MVQRLPDLLQERRCSSSDEKRGRILGPHLGLTRISHPPWAQRARVLEAGVVGSGGTVLIIHCSSCTSWEPDPGSKRPVLDPGDTNLLFSEAASKFLVFLLPQRLPSWLLQGPVSPLAYPVRFPRFTCFSTNPRARCLPWLPALCHCHQLFDNFFVENFFEDTEIFPALSLDGKMI